jgi:SAM-dependent methyltransferase
MLRTVVAELGIKHLSGRLADIGCGTKPYAALLRPVVTEHVGIDRPDTIYPRRWVDVFASADALPVPDAWFDSVLATEVLEHLAEPRDALREWARITRPGGRLLVTVPFIWGIHDAPADFYRFTPFGLRHVLTVSGWDVIELRHVGGFWSTFGQQLAYALRTYERGPLRHLRILPLLGVGAQRLGAAAEARWPLPAWGSHVVAVAARRSDDRPSGA